MNIINHIITSGNEVVSFKTPDASLFDIARNCMFYNKEIVTLPLYNMAFEVKPLQKRVNSIERKFRSCSFEEVFGSFKPNIVGVKLSEFSLNNSVVKLTNRAKSNCSSPLISTSIYLMGPLSNSLYPRNNDYLKHQSFRPSGHYRYQHHIFSLVLKINKLVNKKKGLCGYEFL